jgi:hypothetical protein
MARSVLVHFFRSDSITFVNKVIHKMTMGGETYLQEWARHIMANPRSDPAKEMLRAILFADAPQILAELTSPTLSIIDDLFYDTDIIFGGGFRHEWDNYEYAQWIDSRNFVYNSDTDTFAPTSTSLVHLTDYLRGNLEAATPLIHSIANRIWRDTFDDNGYYSRITQVTFLLHAYLFHYKGWRQHIDDPRVGIVHDSDSHLAGITLPMATHHDWDKSITTSHYGRPEFAITPRVSKQLWSSKGAHIFQYLPFRFNGHELVLADFGDDGVALLTQFEGEEVAYFLGWPDDYEQSIQTLFNAAAIRDITHTRASKHRSIDDDIVLRDSF